MRKLQSITVTIFFLVLACFIATEVYNHFFVDREPPVISCDSDTIHVKVGVKNKALLKGVHATDNADGDLSDKVIVSGVTQLITDNTAKVSYIVFDSSNNMATYTRTVHYTNYEKPHLSLSKPLVFKVGKTTTLLDRLTAHDVIDGDISDKIRVTAQNIDTTTIGSYSVTVQVSNSLGDVESLTLPVLISDLASEESITLSDYILYMDKGDSFDPYSMVESVKNGATTVSNSALFIDNTVDTDTVGTYVVSYSYQSCTVYLTVVVK